MIRTILVSLAFSLLLTPLAYATPQKPICFPFAKAMSVAKTRLGEVVVSGAGLINENTAVVMTMAPGGSSWTLWLTSRDDGNTCALMAGTKWVVPGQLVGGEGAQ